MTIDWEKYSTVAFIDSNIALECLALEQLPWREIDSKGFILVLVTPTVVQEVDSKKNHARLGDHARRFNKTLRPLLTGADTVTIRQSPPQVEIALAECAPVSWDDFPDLDRDEADARVAVQAQVARGPNGRRVIVSQDIRPLYLARQLGLEVYQVSETWLRPKEISEAEKRAASLLREVNMLKSKEPVLDVSLEASSPTVDTYRIEDIDLQERKEIENTIIDLHPMPSQQYARDNFLVTGGAYDHSLKERYARWEEKIIPAFVDEYERKLELNFGQVEIRFRVKNVGKVPAEGLLIRLESSGGWLNEKHVLAWPDGPRAPVIRDRFFSSMAYLHRAPMQQYQPGRHEFVVTEEPARNSRAEICCQDFRHGDDYEYKLVAWVDPHGSGLTVTATVTASNLHGEVNGQVSVIPNVQDIAVSTILDLKSLKLLKASPVAELCKVAWQRNDFDTVEFDSSDWDK